MRLEEIVSSFKIEDFTGDPDIEIGSIEQDSRKVDSTSLFVAISGLHVDGHDFLDDIYEKGCRAVVIDREIQEKKDLNIIRVENTSKALGPISSIFYEKPSEKMNMIGLTGTNGKTTISYMTKFLLEEKMKAASLGTNGLMIGDEEFETKLTTPTAENLQKYLQMAVVKETESFIMEVSSHALETYRVEGIEFNISVFTNLSLDHLDFHETMENYYEAKKKLFLQTKDLAIINTEDEYGKRLYSELKDKNYPLISIGETDQDIRLVDFKIYSDYSNVQLNIFGKDYTTTFPVVTKYNLYNLMATIGIGHYFDLEIDDILKRLENFPGAKGRYEVISNDQNLNLILDFAHSPDALKNILESTNLNTGRKILVFGIAGDRNLETREMMGKIAGEGADVLFITTDDPRVDTFSNISNDIYRGAKDSGKEIYIVEDRSEAIKKAVLMAKEEDVVFFTGKAHEETMEYMDGEVPYSEIDNIEKALILRKNKEVK